MKRLLKFIFASCLVLTFALTVAAETQVITDKVTVKPGINMLTGTFYPLTGENASNGWLSTVAKPNNNSTVVVGTNPDDATDKVIDWTTPILGTLETGNFYPIIDFKFGGVLQNIIGHTNIHVKFDVNKCASYSGSDTYSPNSSFWIMNTNSDYDNMALENPIDVNSGWHHIDKLVDLAKFQQSTEATETTQPTSIVFEMGVSKANTVPTTVFFDNMYVVPAYEFAYYNADGTKLLGTEYQAFDDDGNIITSYKPKTGVMGELFVTSWSETVGGNAVETVSLKNENVKLYAKDYEALVKSVVYNGDTFKKIGETKRLSLVLADEVTYNKAYASYTSSDESVVSLIADESGATLTATGEGSATVTVKYADFEKKIVFTVAGEKLFGFDFDGDNASELGAWTALSNDGVTFNYNSATDARDTMSVAPSSRVTLPEITETSVLKYRYLVITAKAPNGAKLDVEYTTDASSGNLSVDVAQGEVFKDCAIDLLSLSGWTGNNPKIVISNDNSVEIVRIAFLGEYETSGELSLTASGNYLATPGKFIKLTAEILDDSYGAQTDVAWTVSGDTDAVIFVDNGDGTALVAARAAKGNVTVTAESAADKSKKKTAEIEIDVDAQSFIGLQEGFSNSAKIRTAANVKAGYDSEKKITVIDSIAESSTSFYFDNFNAPDMTYKYLVYNVKDKSETNKGVKIFFKTTADKTHTESKAKEIIFTQNSDGTYTAYKDLSEFSTFTAPVTGDIMNGLRPKVSSIELMSVYLTNKKPTDKDTKITLTSSSNEITEDMGSVTLTAQLKTSFFTDGERIVFKILEGGASLEQSESGKATLTATVNGDVKVGAYLAAEPSNVTEITISVSGQREKAATYDFRYLALGHSYLRHGEFTGWPWPDPEMGKRGMAASSYDKDYFARFKHYLLEEFDGTMYSFAENISYFERLCVDGATKEDYKASAEYKQVENLIKTHNPNIITIYVGGGNTKANDYNNIYVFYDTLFELVYNTISEGTLVLTPCHRTNIDVGKACKAAAEKYGFYYSDLSFFTADTSRNNPYYAYNQYPEYDTYRDEYYAKNGSYPTEFRTHPGDAGHDALGKGIFDTAKPLIPLTLKPTYVYLPESISIEGSASVSEASTFTAVAYPADGTNSVTWSVDNENIAVIDENGVLTPVNNGKVTITARSNYNENVVATKTVTVTGQSECFTVTYKAGTTDAVSGIPAPYAYAKDNYILSNAYPERAGYKFGGWSLTEGGEAVKSINVTANTDVYATWIFADRFDFEDDSYNEGVVFNGFNVFIKDGLLCGNCAPGTGFSVARENLMLDSKEYDRFIIKMLVSSDTTADNTDINLVLTVKTTDGQYTFARDVTANVMTEYSYDLVGVTGTITGFIISPDNLECNGNIDCIEFAKADESVVTDVVFEIVGGECDTYVASFGKRIGLCTLVAAAYDENGRMIGIDIIDRTNDDDGTVTVKVAKSLNSNYVKVMAFDTSGNFKVISKEASSYDKK